MNVTWCSCIKPITSVNNSVPFLKDNSFVLLKGVSGGTRVHPLLLWAVLRGTKMPGTCLPCKEKQCYQCCNF